MARLVERRRVYRILVGIPEGKRPLEKPWRMWEDNFKIDVMQIKIVFLNQIWLAQDRMHWRAFVSTVMKLQFP
jgi:hypothetical protein